MNLNSPILNFDNRANFDNYSGNRIPKYTSQDTFWEGVFTKNFLKLAPKFSDNKLQKQTNKQTNKQKTCQFSIMFYFLMSHLWFQSEMTEMFLALGLCWK